MPALEEAAKSASEGAYCLYSKFPVGAAIETKSGTVYTGCNVENVSFGLTMCAERNAIGAMVVAGDSAPMAIVIYTPTDESTLPCGACRQVLQEFNPQIKVKSITKSGKSYEGSLKDLLPNAFSSDQLDI